MSRTTRARALAVAAAGCAVVALTASPASAVTIGPGVTGEVDNLGACSGMSMMANRPCLFLTIQSPGRSSASPCDGTVTSFRLNGVPTTNTYRLRVVELNTDGSYTGVASSNPVSIPAPGATPPYPTNLPIKTGQYVATDHQQSTEGGLYYNYIGPGQVLSHYFYSFPEDNAGFDTPTGTEYSYYLFEAEVACGGDAAAPTTKCKKKKKKGKKKSAAAAKKKKKKGCKKKKKGKK